MKGLRWMGVVVLTAALLLAGCARGQMKEERADLVDAIARAAAEAKAILPEVQAAVRKGDLAGARTAYDRFSQAFGEVLGPVSLQDTAVAQQMANANSSLKQMLTAGALETAKVDQQVAILHQGLQDSVMVMAGGKSAGQPVAAGNQPPPGSEQVAKGRERTVDVTAVDYKFQPSRIEVQKGTRLTIRFANQGTERHEFEIEEYDFEIGPIQPGQVVTQSFVADKVGVYPFECHVDDHLRKGMKGILVVTE